ncbi:MAG: hypothetical protein MZV70_73020 [Desulfobacterales bacterium]|nr:hypothetical protein [Desulfobacterales bacterium]
MNDMRGASRAQHGKGEPAHVPRPERGHAGERSARAEAILSTINADTLFSLGYNMRST